MGSQVESTSKKLTLAGHSHLNSDAGDLLFITSNFYLKAGFYVKSYFLCKIDVDEFLPYQKSVCAEHTVSNIHHP